MPKISIFVFLLVADLSGVGQIGSETNLVEGQQPEALYATLYATESLSALFSTAAAGSFNI